LQIYRKGITPGEIILSDQLEWQLTEKANEVFETVIEPALLELIEEYNSLGTIEVKIVSDVPLISGIDRYVSIMFKDPNNFELIVCVYWIKGSDKIIVDNIGLVFTNKVLDIYTVTKEELKRQVKLVAGLRP
jgi:hypothetical protein